MAPPILLVALRDFAYSGRDRHAGETFAVSPVDAIILRTRGVATFAPPGPPPRKGRYRRRDLRAEIAK